MNGPFFPIGIAFMGVGTVGLAMGQTGVAAFMAIGIAFVAASIVRKQQADQKAEGEEQS